MAVVKLYLFWKSAFIVFDVTSYIWADATYRVTLVLFDPLIFTWPKSLKVPADHAVNLITYVAQSDVPAWDVKYCHIALFPTALFCLYNVYHVGIFALYTR